MAMFVNYLLFHHYSIISDLFNIITHDTIQTFPYLHLPNFWHYLRQMRYDIHSGNTSTSPSSLPS